MADRQLYTSFLFEVISGKESGLKNEGFNDQTKWEPTLQNVSEEDWDIIILGTWQMTEALEAIAPDYPDKRYIIFDTAGNYEMVT